MFTNNKLRKVVSDQEESIKKLTKLLNEKQLELDRLRLENSQLKGQITSFTKGSINGEELHSVLNYESVGIRRPTMLENIETLLSRQETLKGHTKAVRALSNFEKDNVTYLITGSRDRKIITWDLSDLKNPNISGNLSLYSDVFSLTSFKEGGEQFIASGRWERNDVKVFNLKDSYFYTLKGHSGYVSTLSNYYTNGKHFLVSGSSDFTIKIWDTSLKKCIYTLKGHSRLVRSIDIYEDDGRCFLVSGSHDETVKLWSLDNKFLITTLTGHSARINAVKIFYKEGNPYLASGSDDKTIIIWNLNDFRIESTLKGHKFFVWSLELIPMEGPCLVSGSYDKTIKFWNLENYTLLKTVFVLSPIRSLKVLKINDSSYLFSGHFDGSVMVWH